MTRDIQRKAPVKGDLIIIGEQRFVLRRVGGFTLHLSSAGTTRQTHSLVMGFGTSWAWHSKLAGSPWEPQGGYTLNEKEIT